MKFRRLILAIILCVVMPAYARTKTDVIVMKNGDRLTGEIKGLSGGVLYVNFDYILGTSSVDWSKVDHAESKQLFIVKTESGLVYTGTLSTIDGTSDRPTEIEIAADAEHVVKVPQTEVVSVDQTADNFLQRLNGNINLGIIYAKGNQSTQYNLGSEIEYPRPRWSLSGAYQSTLSYSSGSTTSTRNAFNVDGLRLLPWNNWFFDGLGSVRQSTEQHVDVQANIGAGVGRYLKNANHATISVLGGVAWQGTQYSQSVLPQGSQRIVGALLSSDVKLFQFDKSTLDVTAVAIPALNQPGRIFVETNATYYIKLNKNLTWNVSFYGNWDNRPPANFPGSDYGTSSSLGWKFGK